MLDVKNLMLLLPPPLKSNCRFPPAEPYSIRHKAVSLYPSYHSSCFSSDSYSEVTYCF